MGNGSTGTMEDSSDGDDYDIGQPRSRTRTNTSISEDSMRRQAAINKTIFKNMPSPHVTRQDGITIEEWLKQQQPKAIVKDIEILAAVDDVIREKWNALKHRHFRQDINLHMARLIHQVFLDRRQKSSPSGAQ